MGNMTIGFGSDREDSFVNGCENLVNVLFLAPGVRECYDNPEKQAFTLQMLALESHFEKCEG